MAASSLEMEKEQALARARERVRSAEETMIRASNLSGRWGEYGHGTTVGISNALGIPVDVVSTMLSAAGFRSDAPLGSGDNIQDLLTELGVHPEDTPEDSVGVSGGAGEALGTAAVLTPAMLYPFLKAAGDPNFDMNRAVARGKFGAAPRSRAARVGFLLKTLGEDMARTVVKNPKTALSAEAAAATAAGAAGAAAEESGASPVSQLAAEMGAGAISALTVSGIPRAVQSMWRWGMRNLLPFTERGGMQRAARQIQARAENPAAAVRRIDEEMTEGMTPARATRDERLMAQERRMLEDDPVLDLSVREDLRNAIRRTQDDLSGLYGTPRGQQDWEVAVVSRVAPDPSSVQPGTAEEMVNDVAASFKPLYDQFRGYPIRDRLIGAKKTSLDTLMSNVPDTRTVIAGDQERASVGRWLENKMRGYRRRKFSNKKGESFYNSEDLLSLRSDIRAKTRDLARAGKIAEAEILEVAESRINQLLGNQLDRSVLSELRRTDSMYRNFKLVDNAVMSTSDRTLTPNALLRSLHRSASSRGSYGSGEMMELRSLANAGRPVQSLMNNPQRAQSVIASMSEADRLDMKNKFVDDIFRRAISNELGPDGQELISGQSLMGQMRKYDRAARAFQFSDEEIARVNHMARTISSLETKSPTAVAQLFEDGPSNLLQLAATLIGAKSGQRIAGAGAGSQLVMSGYMANKWRNLIAKLTADKAHDLMVRAVRDPDLYKALLTESTARPVEKNRAFQTINSWLGHVGGEHLEEDTDVENMRELRRMAEELGVD